jgi:hypothetical protein
VLIVSSEIRIGDKHIFADGNTNFTSFCAEHMCNRFCDWYGLEPFAPASEVAHEQHRSPSPHALFNRSTPRSLGPSDKMLPHPIDATADMIISSSSGSSNEK